MSYKIGGLHGLKTALKAKTLCTVEIDNQIQISGMVESLVRKNEEINFIKLSGPCQISLNQKQLSGHGPEYHLDGYSSPIGKLKQFNKSINELSKNELAGLNIFKNSIVHLDFNQNITINGKIKKITKRNSKIILISFEDCTVKKNNSILFNKLWGDYDLVCGSKITSVYGGAADKKQYYKNLEIDQKYQTYNLSNKKQDVKIVNFYDEITILKKTKSISKLYKLYKKVNKNSIDDWLLKYQFLEATNCNKNIKWINEIYNELHLLSQNNTDLGRAVKRGLILFS